jgi:2,5-dioxopentanoate dehydrogenase
MNPLDIVFQKSLNAFSQYRETPAVRRASLLRSVADNIEGLGEELSTPCSEETNLPAGRLEGERGRTCNQLRMFAKLLEEGSWVEAVIDTALPERKPLPRPDMRRMLFPLGPVVVFGASNFPLAFSTAGGDTASALAAGCTVVYKGHPAHPRTSLLVAQAIWMAAREHDLPGDIFSHVEGDADTGQQLVKHPVAKAVAFTGSFAGGTAIYKTASERKTPIPVFAEMGSVNPIFILPGSLADNPESLAESVSQSVLLGVGQFCTNPGLVFLPESDGADAFLKGMGQAFTGNPGAKMLHQGIATAYLDGLSAVLREKGVSTLLSDRNGGDLAGSPALATVPMDVWLENPNLQKEVFGPFTLVVRYRDTHQLLQALDKLEGQLTITLLGTQTEQGVLASLSVLAREKCGRLLFSGVPTGVEVSHAMTHGGPFPATTDSRSTSVGTFAIKRFARPVTFQSAPHDLLPDALKDGNPLEIIRLVNGIYTDQPLD